MEIRNQISVQPENGNDFHQRLQKALTTGFKQAKYLKHGSDETVTEFLYLAPHN